MRVIVNENITGTVIRELRQRGHDVLSVKESMRGANDASILQRAEAEQRLVVTQDKDFGRISLQISSAGIVRHYFISPVRCQPSRGQPTHKRCDRQSIGLDGALLGCD